MDGVGKRGWWFGGCRKKRCKRRRREELGVNWRVGGLVV